MGGQAHNVVIYLLAGGIEDVTAGYLRFRVTRRFRSACDSSPRIGVAGAWGVGAA
jgi:hypothetical protein